MLTIESLIARADQRRRLPEPERRADIRQRVGLTQAEVASVVGCSRAAVAAWEAGSREPTGPRRDRYVEALARMAEAAP